LYCGGEEEREDEREMEYLRRRQARGVCVLGFGLSRLGIDSGCVGGVIAVVGGVDVKVGFRSGTSSPSACSDASVGATFPGSEPFNEPMKTK
jgi:hypothetical protein